LPKIVCRPGSAPLPRPDPLAGLRGTGKKEGREGEDEKGGREWRGR